MSGYSSTPLLKKLGYEPGESVYLVHPPDWFLDELEDQGIINVGTRPSTWSHGFFTKQSDLEQFLTYFMDHQPEKGLWLSWPKKASKVATNLTEQTFRDLILPLGWVDTKVAAIDETWSGLKFLRRKK